ncbi:MAG: class A beta-lactamase-related serine hydrolase, partial [Candidatus Taylorbacteria bacterium]|nr:class A beta-lactamase-related serine hydrolase [Candidatus Taylorbacteria bacterium]
MTNWRENKIRFLSTVAVIFLAGGFVGWLLKNRQISVASIAPNQIRADIKAYQFINPLLFANNDKDTSPDLNVLVRGLNKSISKSLTDGDASSVSVYFRDLNTGRWTGINEDDTYTPVSMLKVVVLMAALKIAETNPDFLQKKIYYKPDDSTKFYRPNDKVSAGYYSVQDLVNSMIIYSDNASSAALMEDKEINNTFGLVYTIFRLPSFKSATSTDFMSVKSYSSVFRALYNSTLFQWNLSEQALDFLSKTDFMDGIVAGVPSGTKVSHKFGETGALQGADKTVIHELHDCGIIYYSTHPYLLCVMTRGKD